jgi:hypothetical protein
MKKEIITIIVGVIGIGILWTFWQAYQAIQEETPVACTEEAKLCPDGSSVGRSGPTCEFESCPTPQEGGNTNVNVQIGSTGEMRGVSITPKEIMEDSRCPVDVVCIQAGTVRVRIQLTSEGGVQEAILTLDTPITFAGKRVKLSAVTPAPRSLAHPTAADYVFTFEVIDGSLNSPLAP